MGLVDTGAENVLADDCSPSLPASTSRRVSRLPLSVSLADRQGDNVELPLYARRLGEDFVAWRSDVGFVPGSGPRRFSRDASPLGEKTKRSFMPLCVSPRIVRP